MTPEDRIRIRALVERELPKLKRFFRSKLPEPDCYDVAQETFRGFLAQDPASMEQPSAYLWGIAHKQVARFYERRRPGEAFDSTRMSVTQLGTTLSVRLDRKHQLLHALRSVPLEEQVAFELRYGEECSLEEVAEATGVSLATVKRRIAAARTKLAAALAARRDAEDQLDETGCAEVADAYRDA